MNGAERNVFVERSEKGVEGRSLGTFELVHSARLGVLVWAPAMKSRSVTEAVTFELVVGHFDDDPRLHRHPGVVLFA